MKNLVPVIALGLLLAGCADVSQNVNPAPMGSAIFQADTAQAPDHIAQCVYQPYRGRGDVRFDDIKDGSKDILASANGATIEIISFTPTASGTHVEVHQAESAGRDPLGFIKQARVCGAMSGS
jgi:hypothetical protein